MKKITLLGAMAAALLLFSCKKESDLTGTKEDEAYDGEWVYLDFAMELPSATGTRSATDWTDEETDGPGKTPSDENVDYEYGYEYENDVRTVMLVLANKDGGYLAHTDVSGILQSPEYGKDFVFTITAKFKRKDIDAAYDTNGFFAGSGDKSINVYAYCNYTQPLFQQFNAGVTVNSKDWMDWAGEVVEAASAPGTSPVISNTIWANRSFLMTNAKLATATFPSSKAEWDNYTNESNPFHLSDSNGEKGANNTGNTIYVERAAARLDFKDGSGKDNTYHIAAVGNYLDEEEGTVVNNQPINLFDVKLTRMSLVNMSKKFFYLRRVSDDGTNTASRVGRNETISNYVVDTDWKEKQTVEGIKPGNADTYFNFPLYKKEGTPSEYNMDAWYVDNISDVLKGTSDTWGTTPSYKIWRYVTENTIPQAADGNAAGPQSQQKTIQSIGIVFKGSILPGANIDAVYASNNTEGATVVGRPYVSDKVREALTKAAEHTPKSGDGQDNTVATGGYDYPTLYLFDGLLYAGFDEVVKNAALDGINGMLYSSVEKVLNHWYLDGKVFKYAETPDETKTLLTISIYNQIQNEGEPEAGETDYRDDNYSIELDEADPAFKKAVTQVYSNTLTGNFTLYEASYEGNGGEGWGYYCYYFYWNRHNDNGKSGVMGPMEFATVRNNVYKISVTKIGSFGHPRIPENDPDPVEPEDPDEEEKVYMDVQIDVLPWVVRVNEVEF